MKFRNLLARIIQVVVLYALCVNTVMAIEPPATVRGAVAGNGVIAWEWSSVPNTKYYYLTIDGNYFGHTPNTQFTSYGLWNGEHSLTVVAVAENGATSAISRTAKVFLGNATQPNTTIANGNTTTSTPIPVVVNSNTANNQGLIDPASYNLGANNIRPGYELVFSDEFNNYSMNSFRWNTGLRWDGEYNGERHEYRVVNREKQFYVNIFSEDWEHQTYVVPVYNPFELNGSRLAIRAVRNPFKNNNAARTFGSMREMLSQQDFLSGVIATHGKFRQKYGYFEARIKIPGHIGAFPAFWLYPERRVSDGTQKTEIDIMENLGHAPHYVYNAFHFYKNVSESYAGDHYQPTLYPSGQVFTGINYSYDYHVYAVDWQPGRITWFIDGAQVNVLYTNEANFEELYLKLNLAIGGNWTNFPAYLGGLGRSEGQFYPTQNDLINFNNPALEIDYVRVYRKR